MSERLIEDKVAGNGSDESNEMDDQIDEVDDNGDMAQTDLEQLDLADAEESSVRVIFRVRPFNAREKGLTSKGKTTPKGMLVSHKDGTMELSEEIMEKQGKKKGKRKFLFNSAFGGDSTQEQIFMATAKSAIVQLFKGFHCTIFAYGQTGSGKSWSMMGQGKPELQGIIPRAVIAIFKIIGQFADEVEFTIGCQYQQIYMEVISDLLDGDKTNLKIRESPERGIYVENLTTRYVGSAKDVYSLLKDGDLNRKTAATKMNEGSSRSHSVFTMNITQRDESGRTKESRLHLVDLAGSERVGKTGAQGQTMAEAQQINLSLMMLAKCIYELSNSDQTQGAFVSFRSSILTRLLTESLGGNCKTSVVLCASPHIDNIDETYSTLQFGDRCASVKTQATANIKLSVDQLERMVRDLSHELQRVRAEGPQPIRIQGERPPMADAGTQYPLKGEEQAVTRHELTNMGANVITSIDFPAYDVAEFEGKSGDELKAKITESIQSTLNKRLGHVLVKDAVQVVDVVPGKDGKGAEVVLRALVTDQEAVEVTTFLSMGLEYGGHETSLLQEMKAQGVTISPPPKVALDPQAQFALESATSTAHGTIDDRLTQIDALYKQLMEKTIQVDSLTETVTLYKHEIATAEERAQVVKTQLDALKMSTPFDRKMSRKSSEAAKRKSGEKRNSNKRKQSSKGGGAKHVGFKASSSSSSSYAPPNLNVSKATNFRGKGISGSNTGRSEFSVRSMDVGDLGDDTVAAEVARTLSTAPQGKAPEEPANSGFFSFLKAPSKPADDSSPDATPHAPDNALSKPVPTKSTISRGNRASVQPGKPKAKPAATMANISRGGSSKRPLPSASKKRESVGEAARPLGMEGFKESSFVSKRKQSIALKKLKSESLRSMTKNTGLNHIESDDSDDDAFYRQTSQPLMYDDGLGDDKDGEDELFEHLAQKSVMNNMLALKDAGEDVIQFAIQLETKCLRQEDLIKRQQQSFDFIDQEKDDLERTLKQLKVEQKTLKKDKDRMEVELLELKKRERARREEEKKARLKLPVQAPPKSSGGFLGGLGGLFGLFGDSGDEGDGFLGGLFTSRAASMNTSRHSQRTHRMSKIESTADFEKEITSGVKDFGGTPRERKESIRSSTQEAA